MKSDKRYIIDTSVEIINGKYQWHKAINGDYIDFIHDDIKGKLIIKDNLKDKRKLIISYNDREKEIAYGKMTNMQISDLLYNKKEFRFNTGYKYQNTIGTFIITDRFRENRKKYKVKCLLCGYEFIREESEVKRKRGCPCCSGQIVVRGINDMWTTNPELARLLANPDDGYKYTEHSNQILEWKCPDCGELIYKTAGTVNERGLGCRSCGTGISYPNRFMFNLLRELNVNFKSEKTFNWSEGRLYDFYLEDYNYIIEAHGMQHYEYCGFPISVDEQQKIDKYKEKLANKNKIDKYIVIDCRYSDPEYIMNNVKNSLLGQMFDLSSININELDKRSKIKMIFEIAELYKNGMVVSEITKIYDLTDVAVYNYLHKAEKMGIIKFDHKRSNKLRSDNGQSTYYQNHSTPIKCLENGYYFGSLALIELESEKIFGKKILKSCVCVALKNNKQTYGYTFEYVTREEFNYQKDINPDKTFGDKFIDITIDEKQINKQIKKAN